MGLREQENGLNVGYIRVLRNYPNSLCKSGASFELVFSVVIKKSVKIYCAILKGK